VKGKGTSRRARPGRVHGYVGLRDLRQASSSRNPRRHRYTAVSPKHDRLMKEDERIVSANGRDGRTARGGSARGVMKEFPTRTFDTAIAEQHAVTFAAGMATEGLKPIARSTRRSCSARTIRFSTTWCLMGLDVTFALDRAGVAEPMDDSPRSDGLRYLRPIARVCDHGAKMRTSCGTCSRPACCTDVPRLCATARQRRRCANDERSRRWRSARQRFCAKARTWRSSESGRK